jgi:1-deoxy-D-xylulose-5-phosphate synthase
MEEAKANPQEFRKHSLLSSIESPSDLKKLKPEELPGLAKEIREVIIETVSSTGGHLASSLGAVELAVALHYFYESPKDKIIWDVGHQCYAHKILTGRKSRFSTLRQYKGISGFPKISESEHDVYGTGHASTSISAALGFAVARDLKKEVGEIVAVIGDGSFTGGNALEAINQAGYLHSKIVVILNDNRMSISKNVGALAEYTHRIEKTEKYRQVRQKLYNLIEKGDGLRQDLIALKEHVKEIGSAGLLFEKLGFNYIGPVDGHNISELLEALQEARSINGPILLHARTYKGKGYSIAESNASRYHGVNPFNIENGLDNECTVGISFTDIFGDTLVEMAERDERIIAITAAMADGTGLRKFKNAFPDRFFDVGIAEQHAVVFAAGMAREGFVPFCVIYSTFLQRAYDALIHDVCLQGLPVVFALDRAGLVGNDGPTHHGCFDLSFLRHIPGMLIMAPKDGNELKDMLITAVNSGKPAAVRYPRGMCAAFSNEKKAEELEIGRCEIIHKGKMLTIISIGGVFQEASQACNWLKEKGIDTTLINARFVKPIDERIAEFISETGKAIVVEENAVQGGFGSAVLELCQKHGIKAEIVTLGIPDRFIEHGTQDQLKKDCGLNWENIADIGRKLVRRCS